MAGKRTFARYGMQPLHAGTAPQAQATSLLQAGPAQAWGCANAQPPLQPPALPRLGSSAATAPGAPASLLLLQSPFVHKVPRNLRLHAALQITCQNRPFHPYEQGCTIALQQVTGPHMEKGSRIRHKGRSTGCGVCPLLTAASQATRCLNLHSAGQAAPCVWGGRRQAAHRPPGSSQCSPLGAAVQSPAAGLHASK